MSLTRVANKIVVTGIELKGVDVVKYAKDSSRMPLSEETTERISLQINNRCSLRLQSARSRPLDHDFTSDTRRIRGAAHPRHEEAIVVTYLF